MDRMVQTPEYITRIKLNYHKMRGSEQKLADYLLARNAEEPLDDNVKQLAQKAGVSVASVVRFCQELGYAGYAEFKLITRQVGFLPTVGNIALDGSMSAGDLKKNICDFASVSIQKCSQTLQDDVLEQAIGAICNARRLMICGIGTSAGIAVAAANTFMNLNIPSFPLSEELLMLRTVSMLSKEDVVLGITNCGYVKPIADAMMLAQEAGAVTILITGEAPSITRKYADHVLCSNISGNPSMLDMLTVTSGQLVTIQILQAGCLVRRGQTVWEQVLKNDSLTEMTRYAASLDEIKKSRVKY